jgi:hypothetical protein
LRQKQKNKPVKVCFFGERFAYFAFAVASNLRMRIAFALRRFANPSSRLMAKAAFCALRESLWRDGIRGKNNAKILLYSPTLVKSFQEFMGKSA